MVRRPARKSLLASVDQAVAAGKLEPTDVAAVELARSYAERIDTSSDPEVALEKLGPKLLAALTALGLPAPRAAAAKSADEPRAIDPLAALRAKRRAG